MIVEIRQYQQFGPNGDRATTKVEYFDYEVVLVKPLGGHEVIIARFEGFDSWHSSPLPDRRKEASGLAACLWDFDAGYFAESVFVQYKKKVITTETWERSS